MSDPVARIEQQEAELLMRQMQMPGSWPDWLALARLVSAAEVWRNHVAGLILDSHELPLADAVNEWRNR